MQSTINWKSSVPTHGGRYLIVLNNGRITCDHFSYDSFTGKMSWCVYRHDEIKYWCRVESIKLNNKTEDYGELSI